MQHVLHIIVISNSQAQAGRNPSYLQIDSGPLLMGPISQGTSYVAYGTRRYLTNSLNIFRLDVLAPVGGSKKTNKCGQPNCCHEKITTYCDRSKPNFPLSEFINDIELAQHEPLGHGAIGLYSWDTTVSPPCVHAPPVDPKSSHWSPTFWQSTKTPNTNVL